MEAVGRCFSEVHGKWADTYIYTYLGLNELKSQRDLRKILPKLLFGRNEFIVQSLDVVQLLLGLLTRRLRSLVHVAEILSLLGQLTHLFCILLLQCFELFHRTFKLHLHRKKRFFVLSPFIMPVLRSKLSEPFSLHVSWKWK